MLAERPRCRDQAEVVVLRSNRHLAAGNRWADFQRQARAPERSAVECNDLGGAISLPDPLPALALVVVPALVVQDVPEAETSLEVAVRQRAILITSSTFAQAAVVDILAQAVAITRDPAVFTRPPRAVL
jgi:hypothetical protein